MAITDPFTIWAGGMLAGAFLQGLMSSMMFLEYGLKKSLMISTLLVFVIALLFFFGGLIL